MDSRLASLLALVSLTTTAYGQSVAAPREVEGEPPQLLVAMHGSGRIEGYGLARGDHIGTLATGLPAPNALLFGPDGLLYVSTGVPGGPGAVLRLEAGSGRRAAPFIDIPAGEPGHLERATGMAWHEGDLLVASQGDGLVKRYDGRTGRWKADVARATPGALTEIAVVDGRLYLTDFASSAIRLSDMADPAAPAPVWAALDGHAPWGLVATSEGRFLASTSANRILRLDGARAEEWAGVGGGLDTPVWLSSGPDGLLYAANLYGNSVSVWSADAPNTGGPLRVIGGPEMRSPISLAFGTVSLEAPVQIGNYAPKPSNTGRDWTPDGTAIYNLTARSATAALPDFGLDTEGGDRAKTNLLREPMRLQFTLDDGSRVDSWDLPADAEFGLHSVRYVLHPVDGATAVWWVRLEGQDLTMDLSVSGAEADRILTAELVIPLDPRAMGTTVLAEEWGENGAVWAPLILSALDMGQLRLSGSDGDERLTCSFTGSRLHKRIDLRAELLSAGIAQRGLVLTPARLEKPNASIPDAEWARVRRGLVSLIQITPYMPAFEDGSGWLGSPGGITGNNVISDPVSCNMDRNFQWLTGMGAQATIMGIDLNRIARRTIEYWLNQRMNPDGSLDYVLQQGNISADSNTGVLNAATDYYLSTGDVGFVTANRDGLRRAAEYLISRDVDDDGLIETFRDGNGDNEFGDTGYDTISSGWKNALVNGQAYKSLLGVARMMRDIGDDALASHLRERAIRLRIAYNRTFFLPGSNRYLWWIGQDGKRHDYVNPLIQENAVLFGIADCLERDTGLARGPRDIMQALWDALVAAGYWDSAAGKRVDYIDPATGDYTGFYWGIPCNLEDVPDPYNFADYGSHEFPYYCNGGIFPQDTVAAISAFARAGMTEEADLIRREIFRRQHEGILENGSGFYMGVVNEAGKCYSILKWDGTPTDYEGIISRDCSFLQTALFTDDPARALFDEAGAAAP